MSFDVEKLYSLLPAIYRIRDIEIAERTQLLTPAELTRLQSLRGQDTRTAKEQQELEGLEAKQHNGPLRSLLSVIAEQTAVLEQNLDQLYDDLFIETCAEWVVPYIGDLVGARGITAFPGASFTQRAIVANTLAYRRRKGTAAALEQLAQDVTDWPASVVEYFQLLATTQYLNHLRPTNLSVANIRDLAALESINTPFDSVPRNLDVRRIASQRGKYNIPNIGIFLYRLGDYPITSAPAYRFDDQRYLFDVLGKDIQLFNRHQKEDEISHLAEPINVPMPIKRRAMDRALETYYGAEDRSGDKSVLLEIDGRQVVPPDASSGNPNPPKLRDLITICDLSDLKDQNGDVVTDLSGKAVWAHAPKNKIAIDPELGRIALPIKSPPQVVTDLRVSYRYGFAVDMGGGQYERASTFASDDAPVKVPGSPPLTLQDALDQIKTSGGVVEVETNNQFFETPHISAGTTHGATVELRAADHRRPTIILPGDASGDLIISGGPNSEVTLNGWLIGGGRIRVPAVDADGNKNRLRRLRLVHCTLAPGPIAAFEIPDVNIAAQTAAPRLVIEIPDVLVEIDRCIVGPIRAVRGAEVHITDSIVDASAPDEIAFKGTTEDAGAAVHIENSTVIGKLFAQTIEYASNTIFLSELSAGDSWPAPVRAERLQQGCVRFSFVPAGAQVPRRHRCQPATSADAARVRPRFTSLRYGDAGYCQLSPACPPEIARGADDGSEMGAFHSLYEPRRAANLRAALDEYLRFGLEAGIFYAS